MVIRASMGAIKNAGPHHSGCYYPVYAHCPGIIVVVPSNPADAKGLMKTALNCSDPVVFLEHKQLFGTKGPVPAHEYYIPFGKAKVLRQGTDLTVVSCGDYVNRCVAAANQLQKQGVSCEIIDLRTIVPLDIETVLASVAKTGRLLIVDEAHSMCGVGGEIAARVSAEAFDELDAPIGRLHPDPVTQPFSPSLENEIVVTIEKIVAAAKLIIGGSAPTLRQPIAFPEGNGALTDETDSGHLVEPVSINVTPSHNEGVSEKPARSSGNGIPIMMPNQDLTVTEGTVVRWAKRLGEPVSLNELIVEVETAKAVVPVESPGDGVLGGNIGRVRVSQFKWVSRWVWLRPNNTKMARQFKIVAVDSTAFMPRRVRAGPCVNTRLILI